MLNEIAKKYPVNELINYVGLIAISVSLWNIDFSIDKLVNIPLIFHTIKISGVQLYMLSFFLIYLVSILFMLTNRYYHSLIVLFDFITAINFMLFISYQFGYISLAAYGIYWNDAIFFFGYPIIIVFLFLNSFERHKRQIAMEEAIDTHNIKIEGNKKRNIKKPAK